MSVLDTIIGFTSALSLPILQHPSAQKIVLSKDQYLHHISVNYFHYLYLKYWKYTNQHHKSRMLLATSLVFLSVYVLAPTLKYQLLSQEEKDRMFSSKRADKFTIGLINTRNDCFANSAIQAFASLPGLNLYLNDVIKEHDKLLSLKDSLQIKEDEEIPEILLHEGLAEIMKKLQESITKKQSASVWPFLRVIEKIYNSRISTAQNDAHELVQLILETLDNEIVKLRKFIREHSHQIETPINVPDLPFNGLLADQLTCLSCASSSKPTFYPFSVLSLPVPSTFTANLKEMIRSNEVETITGYNCLRCRIQAILKIEEEKALKGVPISEESAQLISKLKVLEQNLFINDDLDEPLNAYVKNYGSNGFVLDKLCSTIVKKTLVIKPPKLLTVHLSRSLFVANQVARNSCRVEFDDNLEVNIDEALGSAYESQQRELKKRDKKNKEEEEEEITSAPRIDRLELVRSHSKMLTKEEQIEDVNEEQAEAKEQEHHHLESAASDEIQNQSNSSPPPSDSSLQSNHPNTSTTDITSVGSDDQELVSSSNSSIISEQLNSHNSPIRYKLKAVIRHQGTHNAGHYECYRHKPDFMKDSLDDKVVNLTPAIQKRSELKPAIIVEPPTKTNNDDSLGPKDTPVREDIQQQKKKAGSSSASSVFRGSRTPTPLESTSRASEPEYDENGPPPLVKERRRSRLSSFVSQFSSNINGGNSRRGSVANINNTDEQLSQIAESRISLINGNPSEESAKVDGSATPKRGDKRYKKISSVTKYPFWRISDTNVNEVKTEEVLKERGAVYMIYYERINE